MVMFLLFPLVLNTVRCDFEVSPNKSIIPNNEQSSERF